jgi:hypothetical protein
MKTMQRILMAAVTVGVSTAGAQKPPAIRQIGRLERTTTDSLASADVALPMKNGSVLVHDIKGRRVLLFDSTLAHPVLIVDTTDKTSNAYGRSFGELLRYRGDSALFVDVGGLSMMVVDPMGKLGRVMAIPRPDDAQRLLGVYGLPGFDAVGRMIYSVSNGESGHRIFCCAGRPGHFPQFKQGVHSLPKPDSAVLVRIDLATREIDSIGGAKVERDEQRIVTDDEGTIESVQRVPIPLQIVDSWTVTSDGTLAVVRGRDLHVDWLGADGHWTSSPKMPFDWDRLDDARKSALIDSSAKAEQVIADRLNAPRAAGSGSAAGGRGGAGDRSAGRGTITPIAEVVVHADLSDLPDYVPPIDERSAVADAENNLWIRTSARADGRPVYDVVNRRGELIDRIQLPAFRTIAGFGPGVIYMAVADANGRVHLERARVR